MSIEDMCKRKERGLQEFEESCIILNKSTDADVIPEKVPRHIQSTSFDKVPARQPFIQENEGAHPGRFENINYYPTVLSKTRSPTSFNMDKTTNRANFYDIKTSGLHYDTDHCTKEREVKIDFDKYTPRRPNVVE